jgi:hypothetical protein
MAKRLNKIEFWSREVARQEKWIAEHGGSIEVYIQRYGDPGVPCANGKPMYGDGGTAIFNADQAALQRAKGFLENALRRKRVA